jgi:GT2 family glycosyltransferase
MKISIIICTCNLDPLRECIKCLLKTTDLEKADAEVIVAMNGCPKEARDYVDAYASVGERFRYIWIDRRVGLCTTANLAVKTADGEYIVRLDDDAFILDWGGGNNWLNMLLEPFLRDEKVGQTGVALEHHDQGYHSLIGFLTMTTKKLWNQIGGLDVLFDPGGHEDKDYSIKLQKLGYKVVGVCELEHTGGAVPLTGQFPICHMSRVDYNMSASALHEKNSKIFKERYGFAGT